MQEEKQTILVLDAARYLYCALRLDDLNPSVFNSSQTSAAGALQYALEILRPLKRRHRANSVIYLFDASLPVFPASLTKRTKYLPAQIHHNAVIVHELLDNFGWRLCLNVEGKTSEYIGAIARHASTTGIRLVLATDSNDLKHFPNDNIDYISGTSAGGMKARPSLNWDQLDDFNAILGLRTTIPNPIKASQIAKYLKRFGSLDYLLDSLQDIPANDRQLLQANATALKSSRDRKRLGDSKILVEVFGHCGKSPPLAKVQGSSAALRAFLNAHGVVRTPGKEEQPKIQAETSPHRIVFATEEQKIRLRHLGDLFSVPDRYKGRPATYQIRNTNTGEVYFGSALLPEVRAKQHLRDLVFRIHANGRLRADFQTYGPDSFVFRIRSNFGSLNEARLREQLYLQAFWGRRKCYNIASVVDYPTACELRLQLVYAMRTEVFQVRKKIVAWDALDGFAKVYLSLHAAARDLELNKKELTLAVRPRGFTYGGWRFLIKSAH